MDQILHLYRAQAKSCLPHFPKDSGLLDVKLAKQEMLHDPDAWSNWTSWHQEQWVVFPRQQTLNHLAMVDEVKMDMSLPCCLGCTKLSSWPCNGSWALGVWACCLAPCSFVLQYYYAKANVTMIRITNIFSYFGVHMPAKKVEPGIVFTVVPVCSHTIGQQTVHFSHKWMLL